MIYVWKTPIVADVLDIVKDIKGMGLIYGDIEDAGQDLNMRCPFHKGGQERKPSFGISTVEKTRGDRTYPVGTVHCYSCGYTGDLVKFIRDIFGLESEMSAFKWLVDTYNFGSTDERADIGLNLERGQKESAVYIPEPYIQSRKMDLKKSVRAMGYINQQRKISMETLDRFDVGYSEEEDMILIPVRTLDGKCSLIKSRSVEGKRFSNLKGSGKSTSLFGIYQVIQTGQVDNEIWLCESEIDAMTVWSYGGMAIAQMGSHLSEHQVKMLCSTGIRRIRDGLDRDKAGREGWKRAKELLIPKGFRLWNTEYTTDKKDINELTQDEYQDLKRY